MNQRIYIFALLLWLWGGWSHYAHATHSVGAELTYQYVSPNVYRVQLVLYRDCSGLSMATTYQVVLQPSCGAVNPFNLTVSQVGQPTNLPGACGATTTCSGGTAPGFQRYVYQGTVTVPTTCSIWNLTFTDCCRSSAINTLVNSGSQETYVSALLNTAVVNSSPSFQAPSTLLSCLNSNTVLSNLATENDGDSLLYELVMPRSTNGANVTFAASFGPTQPFSSSTSILFNNANGNLQFTPNTNQIGVYAVRVTEYRNGVVVGTVTRDLMMFASACPNTNANAPMVGIPGITGATMSGSTIYGCPNQTFSMFIPVSDADTSARLGYVSQSPPNFMLTANGQGTPNMNINVSGIIPAQQSQLCFTVLDTMGCPTRNQTVCYHVMPTMILASSNVSTSCSPNFPLTVTLAATTNTPGGTYSWSASGPATVSNPTSASTPAVITATGLSTFLVGYTQNGCTVFDTVVVTINSGNFQVSISGDSNVCSRDTLSLVASTTGGSAPQGIVDYTVASTAVQAIDTTGTALSLSDDQLSAAIPLGFSFTFYGNTYTTAYVSSNGFLTFAAGTASGCCAGQVLPNTAVPNDLIALAWEDLNPAAGGRISYRSTGTAPNRRFILTFNNVIIFGGTNTVSGQIILHEGTNVIDVISNSINFTTNDRATQGIENAAGTAATVVPGRNSTGWTASNQGHRFSPVIGSLGATYTWSTGAQSSSILLQPTQSQTYRVTASLGGCTAVDSFRVSVMGDLVVTETVVNNNCSANVSLNIQGGTAPFTFLWSNGATTQNLSGLTFGGYTYEITDANGCTYWDSIIVNGGINIFTTSQPAQCRDSSGIAVATSNVSGASYAWNTGASTATISGLRSGWYSVTVTDPASGCFTHQNVFVGENQVCRATITGYVYADTAQTCNPAGLTGLPNVLVRLSTGQYTYTNSQGQYQFIVYTPSTYMVSLAPYPSLSVHCPTGLISVNVTANNQAFPNNNFFVDVVNVNDLRVTGNTYMGTRPGFSYGVQIRAYNDGSTTQNATITYRYDSRLSFNTAQPAGYVHDPVNHTITWPRNGFAAFAQFSGSATFTLSQQAPMGDTLCNEVEIQPITSDATPANNLHRWCNVITNSWDPNDKRVYPHRGGDEYQGGIAYQSDNRLDYALRFQNTGNDVAYTVVIRDTLDVNHLSLSSIRVSGASHPYSLQLEGGNILTIYFMDINLPDSTSDPLGSMGYFNFSIDLKDNLPLGTRIDNRVAIFFDFNEPVITNTVQTIIGAPVSVLERSNLSQGLSVFPNPARNQATVRWTLSQGSEGGQLQLLDLQGRVLRQYLLGQPMQAGEAYQLEQFDLQGLPAGSYFVRLQTAQSSQQTMLIIKD